MTTEQENKIIEQARQIIETRCALGHKQKTFNLQNVHDYGLYYSGAVDALLKLSDFLTPKLRLDSEDMVYLRAFFKLILRSKENTKKFLDGDTWWYKDHKKNKKNKLESVTAYFDKKS